MLTRCTDCGIDVSSQAIACPRCGAPRRHPHAQLTGFAAIMTLFGIVASVAASGWVLWHFDSGVAAVITAMTCGLTTLWATSKLKG